MTAVVAHPAPRTDPLPPRLPTLTYADARALCEAIRRDGVPAGVLIHPREGYQVWTWRDCQVLQILDALDWQRLRDEERERQLGALPSDPADWRPLQVAIVACLVALVFVAALALKGGLP